jgi:hypothetical protein
VKGDRLAIEIPDEAYQAGLEACKHNLHGRIFWPKGSTPLSVVALKEKLSLIWEGLSKWGIISLGKGFYEFTFSSLEDVKRVRSIPSWNINPGLLKLFAWSRDFNPKLQHNTSAQVWVRIYGLAQEYWHKSILFTIAGSLGTPICTDSVTAKPMHERTFGQFARVLVDIDISQPLRYKILVERKGFAFFVELDYEHIPDFCSSCNVIGHHVTNCKRSNKEVEAKMDRELKKKSAAEIKKVFVQSKDGRPQQSKSLENVNVDTEIINVEDSIERTPPNVNQGPPTNVIQEEDTEIVVPAQQNLSGNNETVLSPRAIFREADLQLEEELNENINGDQNNNLSNSDESTQGTFVDATQHQLIVSEDTNVVAAPSPVRVAKDMEFLKNSWANMMEEDDADKVLVDPGPSVNPNAGFQLVLSKNQKKAQKRTTFSSRDSYTTRSKGTSKPFK